MKTFARCSFFVALALTLLIIGLFATRHAADFPKRTITMLCHFSPGSPVDLMARQLAESAGKILGVSIVVETKKGGSGAVAVSYLLSKKADGYAVFAMTRSNTDLFASGKIKDFAWKDRARIIRVQTGPFVIAAHPSAPFKTAKEMIAYAKKNPGKVKMGGLWELFHPLYHGHEICTFTSHIPPFSCLRATSVLINRTIVPKLFDTISQIW